MKSSSSPGSHRLNMDRNPRLSGPVCVDAGDERHSTWYDTVTEQSDQLQHEVSREEPELDHAKTDFNRFRCTAPSPTHETPVEEVEDFFNEEMYPKDIRMKSYCDPRTRMMPSGLVQYENYTDLAPTHHLSREPDEHDYATVDPRQQHSATMIPTDYQMLSTSTPTPAVVDASKFPYGNQQNDLVCQQVASLNQEHSYYLPGMQAETGRPLGMLYDYRRDSVSFLSSSQSEEHHGLSNQSARHPPYRLPPDSNRLQSTPHYVDFTPPPPPLDYSPQATVYNTSRYSLHALHDHTREEPNSRFHPHHTEQQSQHHISPTLSRERPIYQSPTFHEFVPAPEINRPKTLPQSPQFYNNIPLAKHYLQLFTELYGTSQHHLPSLQKICLTLGYSQYRLTTNQVNYTESHETTTSTFTTSNSSRSNTMSPKEGTNVTFPPTIRLARGFIQSHYVNIFDLVDAGVKGERVPRELMWRNVAELRRYSERTLKVCPAEVGRGAKWKTKGGGQRRGNEANRKSKKIGEGDVGEDVNELWQWMLKRWY